MTKLWRAIEESPLLMDVKDVWRERLGMEFEPLSRFLEATNKRVERRSTSELRHWLNLSTRSRSESSGCLSETARFRNVVQ